ncbi:MAG: LamG domain-containing protein, partial [Flavobacteriales bacterium]
MRTPLLCLAIAFSVGATAQLPGYVPTSGLVAWYPLNNSVTDASGNGLNGTANYTQAAMDRFAVPNGATDFFFASASVSTSPLFNTGAGMTVSAWVNLSDPSQNQKVMGRVNGSFNSGFILGVENGQLHPEVWNSAGEAHAFDAGTIPSNTWTHVAITWATNGYLVAYVNGAAADSIAAGSLPIGTNSEPL